MKALVYTGLRKVKFTSVPKPQIKKNEDLIKVHAAGICGSDLHAFNGLDKIKKKPPIILGHEVSGINFKNNKPLQISFCCCLNIFNISLAFFLSLFNLSLAHFKLYFCIEFSFIFPSVVSY